MPNGCGQMQRPSQNFIITYRRVTAVEAETKQRVMDANLVDILLKAQGFTVCARTCVEGPPSTEGALRNGKLSVAFRIGYEATMYCYRLFSSAALTHRAITAQSPFPSFRTFRAMTRGSCLITPEGRKAPSWSRWTQTCFSICTSPWPTTTAANTR